MIYTKPYLWEEASNLPRDGYALYKNPERKTNSYIFMHGKTLPFDSGNSNLEATKQDSKDYDLIYSYRYSEEKLKSYDCMPNTGHAPLVNKKVLDILNEICPDDIQAFPAVIMPENPNMPQFENHDYWVVNIIKEVAAIDEDKSIFDRWEGLDRLKNVTKRIYKEDSMGACHIARQYNYHVDIVVSPTLVKAFKKAKVTGVKFLKDSEY